jgi:AP endonuclease-2
MPNIPGSDHCPVYADFHDSITLPDGTKLDLWKEMNPNRQPDADPPAPPKFAGRFFDEFSGKQKLLSSFFAKRPPNGAALSVQSKASTSASSIGSVPEPTLEDAKKALLSVAERGDDFSPSPASEPNLEDAKRASDGAAEADADSSAVSTPSNAAEPKASSSSQPVPHADSAPVRMPLSRSQPTASTSEPPSRPQPLKRTSSDSKFSKTKGKEKLVRGQQTLAAFIKRPASKSKEADKETSARRSTDNSKKRTQDDSASQTPDIVDLSTDPQGPTPHAEPPPPSEDLEMSSLAAEDFKPNFNTPSTSAAWSSLLTPKAIPKCIVHGEPAKELTVNKPGPNRGRKFWMCSRGIGAKGDPEARFVIP